MTGRQSADDGVGSAVLSEQTQDRLDRVRQRGHLVCASSDAIPGFGYLADGENAGFDVDLCRAVAAAALGDPKPSSFASAFPPDWAPPSGPAKSTWWRAS